jgi:hypothetical protein
MSLELLGRIHKELALTGNAVHEAILAIAERVNRKVQILRLHWQAAALLQQMDLATGALGRQLADQLPVLRRDSSGQPTVGDGALVEASLARTTVRVHECKQALIAIDAQIRDLKLESIHHNLLQLQRDLSVRSAAIERVAVTRGAAAVGQMLADGPRPVALHVAAVLRGPLLLAPSDNLVVRADDIVILIGSQADRDQFTPWLTMPRPSRTASMKSV